MSAASSEPESFMQEPFSYQPIAHICYNAASRNWLRWQLRLHLPDNRQRWHLNWAKITVLLYTPSAVTMSGMQPKLSACGSVPLYAATMSRSFCCCSGVCSRGLTLWMGLLWGGCRASQAWNCKRSLVASGLDLVEKPETPADCN